MELLIKLLKLCSLFLFRYLNYTDDEKLIPLSHKTRVLQALCRNGDSRLMTWVHVKKTYKTLAKQ